MITVSPTILVATSQQFEERVRAIKPFFTRAQIDVLNNTLVAGTSFADPAYVDSLSTLLTFEVDLMVNLDEYDLAQWNRPWVDMIAVHVEAADDLKPSIETIQSWNKKAFVAINLETDIETLDPYLGSADGVLFMAVEPGRSGNPFKYDVVERILRFRETHDAIAIEVDGGISNQTLPPLLAAGVTRIAVGSYLENKKMEERSLALLEIIEHATQPLP